MGGLQRLFGMSFKGHSMEQADFYENFTFVFAEITDYNASADNGESPEEEYPPPLELAFNSQAVLIALYSATCLLSVVGNAVVIIVLLFGNRSKTELTAFLLNLAIADLCMACFCIPFTFTQTMKGRWIFGQFMCPLVLFMQVTSVTVSIFTNMAIGIDRFWGVIYPLRQRLTKSRAKIAILVIWMSALAISGVQLVIGRAVEHRYQNPKTKEKLTYFYCMEAWPRPAVGQGYTVLITSVTYLLPLGILSFTYYRVGSTLWVRTTPGNANQARDRILLQSKRKVVKMLVVIVAVFAECWLPLHLFNFIMDFFPGLTDQIMTMEAEHVRVGIYYACHWLAMSNSFANPIIYGFLNDSFRGDLRYVFHCCPFIKFLVPPPDVGRTVSTRGYMLYNGSLRSCRSSLYGRSSLRSVHNGSLSSSRPASIRLHTTGSDSSGSPPPVSPKQARAGTQEPRDGDGSTMRTNLVTSNIKDKEIYTSPSPKSDLVEMEGHHYEPPDLETEEIDSHCITSL